MYLTRKHSAKMQGMMSINTSTVMNPFCQKMKETDSICRKCYARSLEPFRSKGLGYSKLWFNNGVELSSSPLKRIPKLKVKVMRLHAFGELVNRMHLENFKLIAEGNFNTLFTLWTKRGDIVKGFIKPANMILIYSEPKVNKVCKDVPENFDKIFVVFNKKFAKENNIEINCEQKCIDCMKCYTHNNIQVINETMKKEKSA